MYQFIKPLLFKLDPEQAHHLALQALKVASVVGLPKALYPFQSAPRTVMGIEFPNPVGLAAGFDKQGDYIDILPQLGFGFIEVGTVTPRPQVGNPKPRIFRIPAEEALINRMGFNNGGLDALIKRLETTRYRGVLGVNIGKNADTPQEKALDDYLLCLRRSFAFATYITVNISSPNTKGLRDLQHVETLKPMLVALKSEQAKLSTEHRKQVPLVVKIAPDLQDEEIVALANLFVAEGIDGVIATNTTISRDGVTQYPQSNEAGGLSGKPLRSLARGKLRTLIGAIDGRIPVIGSGGVMTAEDAAEIIGMGAALVQIYTGLIYRGPSLISDSVKAIR